MTEYVSMDNPVVPFALLTLAILFEATATLSLKLSERHPWCFVVSYSLYGAAFALFPRVLDHLPLGIAYAVWSGAGCVLAALGGHVLFDEALSLRQCGAIGVVLLGITGLLV